MQILTHMRYIISTARCWTRGILLVCAVGFMTGMTPPQKAISREYQVKAVFLYNFCQFVEWPETAFADADDPFIIGVLGESPFDNYLNETVKGEKVDGHALEVKYFQTVEQITQCHILFINVAGKDGVKKVVAALQTRNILTVGEVANFTKQGGIVRFYTEDNKTRIRINIDAAKMAGLTISSKLLKVAEVVNGQSN